jgi:hypothetical protein
MSDPKNHSIQLGAGSIGIATYAPSIQLTAHLPEDHPIYAVIGRITSEWSHLEHLLDLIIWDLSDANKVQLACITAQMIGAFGRTRAIQTLLALRESHPKTAELIKKVSKFGYATSELAEKRNRAIHDPWYLSVGTGSPAQFKSMAFKDPQFGVVDIDEKAQKELIKEIQELGARAAFLRAEIRDAYANTPQLKPSSNLTHRST